MYVFHNIWYLPKKNECRDKKVKAFYDVGNLTVDESGKNVEFKGKRGNIKIDKIISVTYGKQGRDFVNNWVKVDFTNDNEPLVAYFSDGGLLGWKGMFGGTNKMFNALINIE